MSLKEQLARISCRTGSSGYRLSDRPSWNATSPSSITALPKTALKAGDRAPEIVLGNASGKTVDVGVLLKRGPVVVTFYRGGWCPYCNLELKAFERVLPEIKAAGASLVAISPEKPDDTLTTAEKNALTFEVLSDVGQKVGRAFGLVYVFTDELKRPTKASGWTSRPRMARTNGRCRSLRPTSSARTVRSSMPAPMPIIVTAPIHRMSSGS